MTADRVRAIAPSLRRYRGAPNVVFGDAQALREVCNYFGFRNPCSLGRLFLTDVKISQLQNLGLPRGMEWPPEDLGKLPRTFEEAQAQERTERDNYFRPPEGKYVGAGGMPAEAKAYACVLAMQAGWRVDPRDWSWCQANNYVVVQVPSCGITFSIVRLGTDEALAAISSRWGELARGRAQEAIA